MALSPTKSKKKKKKKQKAAAVLRQGSFANVSQLSGAGGANWFVGEGGGAGGDDYGEYEIRDEDLTPEWRTILKNAGIRKRDLKKPVSGSRVKW